VWIVVACEVGWGGGAHCLSRAIASVDATWPGPRRRLPHRMDRECDLSGTLGAGGQHVIGPRVEPRARAPRPVSSPGWTRHRRADRFAPRCETAPGRDSANPSPQKLVGPSGHERTAVGALSCVPRLRGNVASMRPCCTGYLCELRYYGMKPTTYALRRTPPSAPTAGGCQSPACCCSTHPRRSRRSPLPRLTRVRSVPRPDGANGWAGRSNRV
jgi:hypothetical protein